MLMLADLSGIQDYLFHVRETGGKQAKSLRFRSLYIQLIAEAIGVRLLQAADLHEERLLFCAAGKIAVDGGDLAASAVMALDAEILAIESWLRDHTQGRIRLGFAKLDSADPLAQSYCAANGNIQKAKLRSWAALAQSERAWRPQELMANVPQNPDDEAKRDARLGRELTRPSARYLVFHLEPTDQPNQGAFDVAGIRVSFTEQGPTVGRSRVRDLARLARHIPTDPAGQPIEFLELAQKARGAPMLAVLKADADSLGRAVVESLEGAKDLEPLRAFSRRLDGFFAESLDQQMRKDKRWRNLYTVFSGGDDALLVGPWDVLLDFAGCLRNLFAEQFEDDGLTISAGIAIVKPRFPIRLAARQAEDLLHEAKTQAARRTEPPKDQCAALGQLWKWSEHQTIIAAAKQLADWVDQGTIQRGWLHTLLELALLRRGEQPPRHRRVQPLMAASRLAYHIGRNWPQPQDRDPVKRAARQWADRIADQFEQYDTTSCAQTIYLPSILRYAILATKRGDRGEDS